MIASDQQLECRDELEKVLPHEPRGNFIAASQRLDSRLRPAPAFLRLGRGDEPRAAQAGEVGRVTVGVRGGEGLNRGCRVIIGENAGDSVDENRFAVCAGSVQEEQRMFARDAGQGIAANPAQKPNELSIASGDANQKAFHVGQSPLGETAVIFVQ